MGFKKYLQALKNLFTRGTKEKPQEQLPSEEVEEMYTDEDIEEPTDLLEEPSVEDIQQERVREYNIEDDYEAPKEQAVLYRLNPDIFTYENLNPVTDDMSYNVLQYLLTLGYTECMWETSWYRGRIVFDVCDVLAVRTFNIKSLLEESEVHAQGGATPTNIPPKTPYAPPSPIFSHSHVGCRCSLYCFPPTDVEDIPDKAPGLPVGLSSEELYNYKLELFPKLYPISVDRWTVLNKELAPSVEEVIQNYDDQTVSPTSSPPIPEGAWDYNAHYSIDRYKYADFDDTIIPVRIITDFMYNEGFGIFRPIPIGYKGFVLKYSPERSLVYLININRAVFIDNENIEEVGLLDPLPKKEMPLTGGSFVLVDNSLGIIFKIFGNEDIVETVLAYIPELNTIVEIDDWQVLPEA